MNLNSSGSACVEALHLHDMDDEYLQSLISEYLLSLIGYSKLWGEEGIYRMM